MTKRKRKRDDENAGISCGNFAIRFLAGVLAILFGGLSFLIVLSGETELAELIAVLGFLAFVCAYIALNPSKKQMHVTDAPPIKEKRPYQEDKSTSFSYEVSRLVRVLLVGASGFIFFTSVLGLLFWVFLSITQPSYQMIEIILMHFVALTISGAILFTVKIKPPSKSKNIRDELDDDRRKNDGD
ncbi:MAG: hypothetical protein AAF846_29860 [Chloroflexota bacterium]